MTAATAVDRRENVMRKVIVCNIMSLDGRYTGPADDVMVMPMDESFDRMNIEHMRSASTLLLGRATYELFRSYWPPVADRPEESDDNRAISRRFRDLEIVVVSDTLTPDPSLPWHDNTVIVGRSDAAAHVATLKGGDGGDILTFGSHAVWTGLLRAGAVDELHLMVGAALVGAGRPMFAPDASASLRLLGVTTSTRSSNVIVRYAVD
jgi:dihydrofolate reductase